MIDDMQNEVSYYEWLERPIPHPELRPNDEVILVPVELGGGSVHGRIRWENATKTDWAVAVITGAGAALIYVNKADVAPYVPESGETG